LWQVLGSKESVSGRLLENGFGKTVPTRRSGRSQMEEAGRKRLLGTFCGCFPDDLGRGVCDASRRRGRPDLVRDYSQLGMVLGEPKDGAQEIAPARGKDPTCAKDEVCVCPLANG
jgi:hypothetical protein